MAKNVTTVRLDDDQIEFLDAFAAQHNTKRANVIRSCIRAVMDHEAKKQEEN